MGSRPTTRRQDRLRTDLSWYIPRTQPRSAYIHETILQWFQTIQPPSERPGPGQTEEGGRQQAEACASCSLACCFVSFVYLQTGALLPTRPPPPSWVLSPPAGLAYGYLANFNLLSLTEYLVLPTPYLGTCIERNDRQTLLRTIPRSSRALPPGGPMHTRRTVPMLVQCMQRCKPHRTRPCLRISLAFPLPQDPRRRRPGSASLSPCCSRDGPHPIVSGWRLMHASPAAPPRRRPGSGRLDEAWPGVCTPCSAAT